MTIELIVDENCFSAETLVQLTDRLALEFSNSEIFITSFELNPQRMKRLGINILPAWVINNQVIRINPHDFDSLKKRIYAFSEKYNRV